MIEVLDAVSSPQEKIQLLTQIFHSREFEHEEMEHFLKYYKEKEPNTELGRVCARFLDILLKGKKGKSDTFDEQGILFQIRTRSVSDYAKLELLNQNLRFLYRSAGIMQWLDQQAKHGTGGIKTGCQRILEQIEKESRSVRPALTYDDVEGLQDPVTLEDFLGFSRTQKLWWLMAKREDSARDDFVFQHVKALMQSETDPFVVSNLVKRIPDAIAMQKELYPELVKALEIYHDHEDNRVRANLLEGYDVLMQKPRYRGMLYSYVCDAAMYSTDNRIRSTALRIRHKYAPRETRIMVEDWIRDTKTLATLASVRWLIESVPDVKAEFATAIKGLEAELSIAARKLIAERKPLTGETVLR